MDRQFSAFSTFLTNSTCCPFWVLLVPSILLQAASRKGNNKRWLKCAHHDSLHDTGCQLLQDQDQTTTRWMVHKIWHLMLHSSLSPWAIPPNSFLSLPPKMKIRTIGTRAGRNWGSWSENRRNQLKVKKPCVRRNKRPENLSFKTRRSGTWRHTF